MNILIIGHDRIYTALYELILEYHQYELHIVSSVLEAMDLLTKFKNYFDLIIFDDEMTIINELELLNDIKNTPIFICTTNNSQYHQLSKASRKFLDKTDPHFFDNIVSSVILIETQNILL